MLHACNGMAEREKIMSSGQEPSLVTFSRKGRRQSEPAPAVKAGTGAEPESRKRPADVAALGARPAQRPRLVPNGVLPAPKVPPPALHSSF